MTFSSYCMEYKTESVPILNKQNKEDKIIKGEFCLKNEPSLHFTNLKLSGTGQNAQTKTIMRRKTRRNSR